MCVEDTPFTRNYYFLMAAGMHLLGLSKSL